MFFFSYIKVSTFILELFSIEKKVFYFLAGAAITQVLSIHYGMWFFGVPPFLVFSLIAIPLTVHALKKAFPTTLNFSYRHNVNIFFLCACSFLAIFMTHFGQRNIGWHELLSYMLLGTVSSFFILYFIVYGLIPKTLYKKSLIFSKNLSAFTMWLGYLVVIPGSEPVSLFTSCILVIMTPFLYILDIKHNAFAEKEQSFPTKSPKLSLNFVIFLFFVISTYSLFTYLTDFNYSLSW